MKILEVKTPIDRYIFEKELYTCVLDGNKEKVNEFKEDFINYMTYVKNRADKNEITRLKYTFVGVMSIISRSTIEKGKSVSESFSISDDLFKRIDFCRTIDDIIAIGIEGLDVFTNLNFERTDLYSLPIRKAIDYINTNIKTKILITDICKVVKLSNDYLSCKFKEEVGINISDYIMNKKLGLSKDNLMFNTYSKDLYKKYGFSSQSYFIQCFKKKYGMTPKDYYLNVIEKKLI